MNHGATRSRVFRAGAIEGVELRKLQTHVDPRGWLTELFRSDEAEREQLPAMGYVSLTHPGVTRGPHEHVAQTDWFCFLGPSSFLLVLWDNRRASPSFERTMRLVVGEDEPTAVIVPPGVVHGYRNVGPRDGWVVNLPNRLFKGPGRAEPVDEIRHEAEPDSPFDMDAEG
jgi:dTDP-4-dehydrorhamnose 3,5-epimerase